MRNKTPFVCTATLATTLAAALSLAGCASRGTPPAPQAAFVVLGDGGAPIARVITTAASCPAIVVDGRSATMGVRAPLAPIPPKPATGASATNQAQPPSAPVLVCETALPAGATGVQVAGRALPLPKARFQRIVVIGDTGCRIKGEEVQPCNDPQAYPFARVAASAAAWRPDLVVHVGDYHYRESPCPDGRADCAGSPWGYGWEAWNADFFTPARPLLAAAPWVMVRGNHENCARAGQGWWRFLDPHPLQAGRACDAVPATAPGDDSGDYSDPYTVPVGPGIALLVFDTGNTSYKGFGPADPRLARYRDLRRRLDALAGRAPHLIAVGHHPLYAFGAERNTSTGEVRLFGADAGLVQAFGTDESGRKDARLLPSNVDMMLSGHVHLWEQLSFSSDHPTQFVSGFSGTAEDTVPLPVSVPTAAMPAPGAQVEALSTWLGGFGFMTMERSGDDGGDNWTVVVHDRDGAVHATCRVEGRRSVCR
jgi:hypothetical protein